MNTPITRSMREHATTAPTDHLESGHVQVRNRTLLGTAIETIQHLHGSDLMAVQQLLRHGNRLGQWLTPEEWLTPGRRIGCLFTVDLRKRVLDNLPKSLAHHTDGSTVQDANASRRFDQALDLAVLSITRYLVLLRMGPAGMGRTGAHRSIDPGNICRLARQYLSTLTARAVAKWLIQANHLPKGAFGLTPNIPNAVPFFSLVQADDLADLTQSARRGVLHECRRMRMLADRGLWCDVPALEATPRTAQMKGAALCNDEPSERNSHLPLPDDYAGEMGSRSIWLMRSLAPNVFVIGRVLTALWDATDVEGEHPLVVRHRRRDKVSAIFAAHQWVDEEGQPFSRPKVALVLTRSGGFGSARTASLGADEPQWPPRNFLHFMALLKNIQMAHYFIVVLSMGARQSETLDLRRNCVSYASDGRTYANGKTYKLVQRHEGEWREWLLPKIAAEAIEQQVRLVSLGEKIGYLTPRPLAKFITSGDNDKRLWAQLSGASGSDPKLPLHFINPSLQSYARALRMDAAPGGQSLRSHRFRKTLARLVALALTQAPKLLMEVFGHKSIEMTLSYILTDKDLSAEIETVTRELRVMRAKEAVERMVEAEMTPQPIAAEALGGYGGLGAITVHKALEVHRDRVHRRGDTWGAKSVVELAELLTLQGQAWEQVRRGVVCTKFVGEAGPCSRSKGRPEPSKCQTGCSHRLEERFLREDVDGAIADSVASYEIAMDNDESLTAAHWVAQVRAHVPRFPDLHEKWMCNKTVQSLMGGVLAAEGV